MSTYPFPGNILIDEGELDALPWGAIIVDVKGDEWRHTSFYYGDPHWDTGNLYWTDARRKGGPMFGSDMIPLPARLLYATGIYAPGVSEPSVGCLRCGGCAVREGQGWKCGCGWSRDE